MKYVNLFVFVVLVMALTACPSNQKDTDSPDTSASIRNFSGTVVNVDGSAYRLGTGKVILTANNTAVGTIATNGTFNVELPKTLANTQLSNSFLGQFNLCKNIISEGADAVGIISNFALQDAQGKTIANLMQATGLIPTPQNPSVTLIQRIYVDKKVVVKGICNIAEGAIASAIDVDITLQKGWNLVVGETRQSSTGLQVTMRSASSVPANVKFLVLPTSVPNPNPNPNPNPSPNPNPITQFSGTALSSGGGTYDKGAGTIVLVTNDGTLNVGTIAADGSFTVMLPNDFTDAQLLPVIHSSTSQACRNLFTEGQDALGSGSSRLEIRDAQGKPLARLQESTGVSISNTGTITTVMRFYANKKVVARGICEIRPAPSVLQSDVDVNFSRGWNLSTIETSRTTSSTGSVQVNKARSVSSVPSGMRFFAVPLIIN